MTTSTGAAESQGMQKTASFSDAVSAADTSIGFEYQYYYYLDRLVNLKTGQSVGLEVKDDVHSDLQDGYSILVQLKHTVQTNAFGAPTALTELDSDLWKTLHNWAKIICDDTQHRNTAPKQLEYIKKTEFHLVTNKSHSSANKFLAVIVEFQESLKTAEDLRDAIDRLEKKTTNAALKTYIQTVLDLSVEVFADFFKKVRFELGLDKIIARVKRSIREKFVDEEKIDSVFERLDSNIREDNFHNVKKGVTLQLTFDEFWKKYKKVFGDGRSKKLQYTKFSPPLPSDLFAQTFVRRLLEVGAIEQNDVDSAVEYTLSKLRLVTCLDKWRHQGQVVSDDITALHDDVIIRWRNEFQVAFRKCTSEQDIADAAINMLTHLRRERFILDETELPTELSNGELYHLSDIARIGWHKNWRTK